MKEGSITVLLWLAALLFFVVIGVGLAWWLLVGKSRANYTETNTVNAVLARENSYYAQAEHLGKLIGSTATGTNARVELYQKALEQAQDLQQEGQIKYKLALAYIQKSDYMKAIPILKEIAANTTYTNYHRAYAVQQLANLHFSYADPEIEKITFSDVPYSAMTVAGDVGQAYRNLYEYASSFYPLDIAESRIADWYAGDIIRLVSMGYATSSSEVQNDLYRINTHIAKAKKDITRTETDPNSRVDIPTALMRVAVVNGKLAKLGLLSPEEAEKSFETARQSSDLLLGTINPYWYYNYADFLTKMYGIERKSDVENTLSNIYGGPFTSRDPILIFLRNERQNALGAKSSVANLAKIDQKFRVLLASLGWTEVDFK